MWMPATMSVLRLASALLLVSYFLYAVEARTVFVSAPNTIRLDAEETISIVTDSKQEADAFSVYLQDFPARKDKFSEKNVIVKKGIPVTTTVKASHKNLPDIDVTDPARKTYVYLVVNGNDFSKEFKILVSPRSGYMFIQTDKPIYTPQQDVKIRILPLNEHLLPKNENVRLQIRNPQDIVVHENVFTKPWDVRGELFPTYSYRFPPHPLLGEWSIVVQYGHEFQTNSTVTFKVEEYVLPTYTVMVDVPNVILPEHTSIRVHVVAEYVYKKKVKGTVLFTFSIKNELEQLIEIGKSKTIQLEDGEAEFLFTIKAIMEHPKVNQFPHGSKLVVEVEVVDAATGNREKAINEEATFANSPYIISFKNSQRDFKPGLVSVVVADVAYINGNPAAGIPTSISVTDSKNNLVEVTKPTDTSDEDGRVLFNINTPIGSSFFTVMVTTNDPNYKKEQQFVGRFELSEYKSPTGGYIAISRLEGTKKLKIGSVFSATVFAQPAAIITHIFFLVLSRGRIVETGQLSTDKLLQRELHFEVTAEMAPSLRIVTYALYKNKLIADSIRVDVENQCKPQAEVKIETKFHDTSPGSEGKFLLRGQPDTSVGVLAVDSAIYALRNKDRLTKQKLFKALEGDDLGCGPGGGRNTELVLANAGLTIFGNFDTSSMEKNELGCIERRRRKREAIEALVNSHDDDNNAGACCKLGTMKDKQQRTCEERTSIVRNYMDSTDNGSCADAYLKCCKELEVGASNESEADSRGREGGIGNLGLSFVEDLDEEEETASTRKDFRETWLFQDYLIGFDGTKEVATNLPHSITTWIIQAVSISKQWGMCVSEPNELVSFKKIFLHLNLPYSVVRNEQVEVQATIFNYYSEKVPVTIYMYGAEDLCTGVQAGKKQEEKKVWVDGHSTASVGFPVIPLKDKEYTLRVVALSKIGHDAIEKVLRVVPEGVLFEETIPVVLDPANQRRRKQRDVITDTTTDSIDESQMLQLTTVQLRPSRDYIPGTESCTISAVGDEFGPTVETVVNNPETLVRLPIGCGEQTMMFMGPTVYTLRYLKSKGKVTPEFEGKVYGYVREGYNRELTFRKTDGSFAAWKNRAASTWLTAFVMKIFCQSSKFIFVDQNVVCSGVKWLIQQQNADGSFTEKNPVIHRDMMGGNNGAVPMTAFVLISLQECECKLVELGLAKLRAVLYLEGAIPNINDHYVMSLVSYALALSNSELKQVANQKLQNMADYNEGLNQRHWNKGSKSHGIETTAYALLAQVVLGNLQYSLPIVNWLNTQRLAGGVFPSTQDTVVALQALSEYSMVAQTPVIDLHCNVSSSTDRKLAKSLHFQNDNAQQLQQFELDKVAGTVFFRTSGSGVGLLSVKLRYNVPRPIEKLCKFDVTVNVTEAKEVVRPAVIQPDPANDMFDELPPALLRDLGFKDNNVLQQPDGIKVNEVLPEIDDRLGIDPRLRDIGDDMLPPDLQEVGPIRGNEDGNDYGQDGDIDLKVDGRARVDDDVDYDDRNRVDDYDDDRNRANGDEREKADSKIMYEVKICARYLSEKETDMSIIDVGIFSGFKPRTHDLDKLVNDTGNTVDRYELVGRGIIFYLSHVPRHKPVCLNFHISREFIVGAVQPSVIKVYDYYSTDESCTIFYRPDSNSPLLRKICEGSVCQCAEGGCPQQEPFQNIPESEQRARGYLFKQACERNDYVWKGKVQSMKKKEGFIHIEFKIEKVLKPGIEPTIQIEGLIKTLLLQDSCTTFELTDGQTYIIMGKDGERFEDRETKQLQYRYLIDKTTSIQKSTRISDAKDPHLQKILNWLGKVLLRDGCKN